LLSKNARFETAHFYFPTLAAAATATAVVRRAVVAAAAATAARITIIAVARKKKRRDDNYPDKAFVIEKIANAVHKNFLPIELKSKN
jgi:hypothetical protein